MDRHAIPQGTPDPRADELHDVHACDAAALTMLAARIEQSCSDIELVYREAEIDEVWRRADVALSDARHHQQRAQVGHWSAVRDELMRLHDLLGVHGDLPATAQGLRALAARLDMVR